MKLMGSEPYEVIGIIDNRQVFSSTNTELNGLYLVDMEKIQKFFRLKKFQFFLEKISGIYSKDQ